jgi:hypothetical protein
MADESQRTMGNEAAAHEMDELRRLFRDLEQATSSLLANRHSLDLQSKVCLATRSAFTHFHSLSVIDSTVDQPTAEELRRLLTVAMKTLPPGKYYESVQSRLDDFIAFCTDPTVSDEMDTAVV